MAKAMEKDTNTEGRALLTESERQAIAGDKSDSYRYKTKSYLKRRIKKLDRDIEIMAKHEPELLAEIQQRFESTDVANNGTQREYDLPGHIDSEAAAETVDTIAKAIETDGPMERGEIVETFMPDNPHGYDAEKALQSGSYRGGWWRNVVKPGLEMRGFNYRNGFGWCRDND